MRSLETAFDVRAGGVLRSIPRHPLMATTLCAASIGGLSGAMAQTAPAQDNTAPSTPPQGEAEKINVTGLRPLINDKLPTGLQDAPQSITVVSEQIMKEQGTTRLQDARKNAPAT